MNKRGIAYCVGVGPGDPELMTLKAVRLIRENDVIAAPGEESVACSIAAASVPEIEEKEYLLINTPMTRDRAKVDEAHREAAKRLEGYLDQGRNVVYLTLGDPTLYCTFGGIQRCLERDGYAVELVNGVPSFCATAARLNMPLAEWDESLHIVPAAHQPEIELDREGTCVLMKAASRMKAVREQLRRSGRRVGMVENCGMEGERVFHSADEIPDNAGYFSTIIAKENRAAPPDAQGRKRETT